MRVLITGHTGFIGSNMFRFLKNVKSVEPVGYSKSTGQDIFDLSQLMNAVKDCDLLYHFAAYTKPAESVLNPVETIETNIKGTLNILEACRRYDRSLVYISSCEIYGDSEITIKEDAIINPPNPYAASKAAVDRICYAYFKSYGLDVKIARLFNPYGPNQQLNKIIPTFYFQAAKNKPISVFGDGTDTRDYVYIDDIVRGLWYSKKLPSGEVINLATGKATTNLEVANLVKDMTDSTSKIKFVAYPKVFGGIKNQVSTYEKAETLIGWKPRIDLFTGAKQTIAWLAGNRGQ